MQAFRDFWMAFQLTLAIINTYLPARVEPNLTNQPQQQICLRSLAAWSIFAHPVPHPVTSE